jgi:CHASE3 domain sensor protein
MNSRFFKKVFHSDNLIYIGIGFIAFLILHLFVVSVYSKKVLTKRNEFIKTHMAVLKQIDQIGTNVNLIDLGYRGYYLVPTEKFKSPLEIARTQHKENMDSLEYYMSVLEYPHQDSIKIVDRWIGEYFQLADKGIEAIDQGNHEAAVALFADDPGYDLWMKYASVQGSMRSFINALSVKSQNQYRNITQYAFLAQLLLVCFGSMVLMFVFYRMWKHKKEIQHLFDKIKESNIQYVFSSGDEQENENNEEVIERMTGNLKHAAEFIQNISRGNLGIQWKGLTKKNEALNKETLAGELSAMRDQMIKVKEDEGNRIWISEGISQISELVRKNQHDLHEMGDRLLAEVVKYLKANQAGLFFHVSPDEGDPYLELTNCYAYDKKKYEEKKVPVDSGMLGQCFLEGGMVHLKEIPEDYIHITSGLGEIAPQNLLLIPLKFNDEVVGVMEIASLTPFTRIHLEFLSKISEIIASAITTTRNSEQMQELLEHANQTSEEMRSQEEEMRQNMEELQATQEELARKEIELLGRIEELENEKKMVG